MNRNWLWIGAGVGALALLFLPTFGVGAGQVLFLLLLALCPLMHLFGAHGHGGHGDGGPERGPRPGERSGVDPGETQPPVVSRPGSRVGDA